MSERVAPSFQRMVIGLMAVLALVLVAILLHVGGIFERLLIAAAGYFLLQWAWKATRRKRALASRGFHPGHRVGHHWVYEELHEGEIVAIELPLAYVGRGEYEILVPGEQSWPDRVPAWARERRGEIVERLGTVFKRSEMRTDD
jgi:hypothetical protein